MLGGEGFGARGRLKKGGHLFELALLPLGEFLEAGDLVAQFGRVLRAFLIEVTFFPRALQIGEKAHDARLQLLGASAERFIDRALTAELVQSLFARSVGLFIERVEADGLCAGNLLENRVPHYALAGGRLLDAASKLVE